MSVCENGSIGVAVDAGYKRGNKIIPWNCELGFTSNRIIEPIVIKDIIDVGVLVVRETDGGSESGVGVFAQMMDGKVFECCFSEGVGGCVGIDTSEARDDVNDVDWGESMVAGVGCENVCGETEFTEEFIQFPVFFEATNTSASWDKKSMEADLVSTSSYVR